MDAHERAALRKETDYGSLFSCIDSGCPLCTVPALLPHAERQALAENERNALTAHEEA